MNEELRKEIADMELVAKHTFDRVKAHLLSGKELTIEELGNMIDIAKDASCLMKNATKIKSYYAEHSEKYV